MTAGCSLLQIRKETPMQSLPKDPVMLLSVVNTMLRDKYDSFDALSKDLTKEVADDISKKLNSINYIYDKITNQFI